MGFAATADGPRPAWALALVAAAACTVVGKYEPERFADWRIAADMKLAGCAAVRTAPEDDALVYRGRPSGVVGSAVTLEVPLGKITREAARRVFGDLFLGGAVAAPVSPGEAPCAVAITPRATRFEWSYPGLGTPLLEVSVAVLARDASGRVLVERSYDSGPVRGEATGGARAVVAATHVALQALMLRAAEDLRAQLVPATAPASPRGAAPGD